MTFSLTAKFISEVLATAFAIFLGTSVVANELLPSTKGHGQGYYSTCFGFTFAFVVSSVWFGNISANMNPAMFFYLALRNELEQGWLEFAVGSGGSFIGGFLGGCLTYFYWAPHFWTIPLPLDTDPVSRLIHGPPDALSSDAGRLASAFGDNSKPDAGNTFKDEVIEFGRDLVSGGPSLTRINTSNLENDAGQNNEHIGTERKMRKSSSASNRSRPMRKMSNIYRNNEDDSTTIYNNNNNNNNEPQSLFDMMEEERRLRSESSAGRDVFFAHLHDININPATSFSEDTQSTSTTSGNGGMSSTGLSTSKVESSESLSQLSPFSEDDMKSTESNIPFSFLQDRQKINNYSNLDQQEILPPPSQVASSSLSTTEPLINKKKKSMQVRIVETKKSIQEKGKRMSEKLHLEKLNIKKLHQKREEQKQKQKQLVNEVFDAAIRADQSAKLSIFCTRPAKYNRIANFLQEVASTFFLIFGLKMLDLRLSLFDVEDDITSPYTQGILATCFIIALSLGLGGTTGFAVNPARDIGPRLAHFMLPVAGKGDSEWYYAWVPGLAPFVGAGIAAGVMNCMDILYASSKTE